ncbi:MAG: hypothetical protein JOZ37_12465 [Actinobacteria bacterium]|nr:hypothetical protein [Actinomycetota bacterium]
MGVSATTSLALPVAIIATTPLLVAAVLLDQRRRRRLSADRQAATLQAIDDLADAFSLVERPVADPVEAFPPSEVSSRPEQRDIRRDQQRRRGASVVAWAGCAPDGRTFELFRANRLMRVDAGSGSVKILKQHDLVRTAVDHPSLPSVVTIGPVADFRVKFLSDVGWYVRHKPPGRRTMLKFKAPSIDNRHEVRYAARSDPKALSEVVSPAFSAWLASVSTRIRFELVNGILSTFQYAQEDEPASGPVDELIEAAMGMARFLAFRDRSAT